MNRHKCINKDSVRQPKMDLESVESSKDKGDLIGRGGFNDSQSSRVI